MTVLHSYLTFILVWTVVTLLSLLVAFCFMKRDIGKVVRFYQSECFVFLFFFTLICNRCVIGRNLVLIAGILFLGYGTMFQVISPSPTFVVHRLYLISFHTWFFFFFCFRFLPIHCFSSPTNTLPVYKKKLVCQDHPCLTAVPSLKEFCVSLGWCSG